MVAAVNVSDFELTCAEHARLHEWAAGAGRVAVRARIVLACPYPGVVYARLADDLGVSVMTVMNVRRRFAESRLAGLEDRPRPRRPKAGRSLSEDERDQLRRWAAGSSCPPTRYSWRRSSTSSASTTTRRRRRSCCAWTRSPSARPWTVPAGPAHGARHSRAAHPRLRPARRDQPVRRLQHRHR